MVVILQKIVAFSEYMNFTNKNRQSENHLISIFIKRMKIYLYRSLFFHQNQNKLRILAFWTKYWDKMWLKYDEKNFV